jgi:hypothetical protein
VSAARRHAALGALCVAVACGTPEQQLETDRRFVSITYTDTIIESFSRTNRAITGVLISGEGDSVRFRIRTMPKGLVAGVDVTLHPASSRGEPPATRRVGMPKGTLPLMQTSVAFLEQLLRRARAVGGDSVSVPVMLVGAQASLDVFTVIANGSDSVLIVDHEGNPTNALHLAVDSAGRILGGVVPVSGTRISAVRPP